MGFLADAAKQQLQVGTLISTRFQSQGLTVRESAGLPGAEQAQAVVIDTLGFWGNVAADVFKHLPPFSVVVPP